MYLPFWLEIHTTSLADVPEDGQQFPWTTIAMRRRKAPLGIVAIFRRKGNEATSDEDTQALLVASSTGDVGTRVERFDRRGTETFEPFESFEPFEFFQNSGIFPRKFKKFRKFQHFLNYRRNSDKISSKSEQKSMKRIQK